MDGSVHLGLFQRNLTGTTAKWYIEFPQHSFLDFSTLVMAFLTHFQLLIWYKMGTDILISLHQTTSTHISDHIHEWRRRRRLIKAPIPDQLLSDWFTKSLLRPIAQDVSIGDDVIKEKSISQYYYIYLVYSQSGTFYDFILHAPCPTSNPSRPSTEPLVDGVLGSVQK